MNAQDRAVLLAMAPQLAPGADATALLAFLRDRGQDALDELGAVPGHDGARAVVLRALPALGLTDVERADGVARARVALEAFEGATLDRQEALRRHPSWVVLAAREWAERSDADDADDVVAGVWAEAGAALSHLSPGEPCGPGEVAWAVAETADEVGWSDHADVLFEAAAAAAHADPENLGRVLLIRILRRLERDDLDVGRDLAALLRHDALDDRTRVHAHWLSALHAHEQGRNADAFLHLDAALEQVDPDEDPEMMARLLDAHRAWGGGGAGEA